MIVGVILAIGESLGDFEKKGQFKRLLNYNIRKYCESFEKVYLFSYADESYRLPKNCILVANKKRVHRFIYCLLLSLIHHRIINQCDVLRGLQLTGGIPAIVAKIIFDKKFIINYGYDYSQFARLEGRPLQSFLYKILKYPIIKLADAVIATSYDIKNAISKIADPSKIFYIPNGVDLKLFKIRHRAIKKEGKLRIIYIGRLEKQKNLDSLIYAISILKDRFPRSGGRGSLFLAQDSLHFARNKKIEVSFFGQGSQKQHLLKIAKKLGVNLAIHDPIDYGFINTMFSKFDIFVLPSKIEGNPKILLEAMASGIAVIGSNVIGIKEIIIDKYNGILCEGDPNSIAEAIEALGDVKLRAKIGANAREFVAANFDIENLLVQEIDLIGRIAAK